MINPQILRNMEKVIEFLEAMKRLLEEDAPLEAYQELIHGMDARLPDIFPPEQLRAFRSLLEQCITFSQMFRDESREITGAQESIETGPKASKGKIGDLVKKIMKTSGDDPENHEQLQALTKKFKQFTEFVNTGRDSRNELQELLDDELLQEAIPGFVKKVRQILEQSKHVSRMMGGNMGNGTLSNPKRKLIAKVDAKIAAMKDNLERARERHRNNFRKIIPGARDLDDGQLNNLLKISTVLGETFAAVIAGDEPPILGELRATSDDKLEDQFPEGFVRVHGNPIPVNQGWLQIKNRDITSMDEITGLENLQNLKGLAIERTGIEILEVPASLKSLKSISAKNNHIKEVRDLKHLDRLVEMDLSRNKIHSLDSLGVGGDNHERLERLILDSNKLESLDGIESLPNLKELGAADNQLLDIPDILNDLSNLERLNLGWNQIEQVPSAIPSGVKRLILAGNHIEELDDDPLPPGLEMLDLAGNRLKSITLHKDFPALRHLHVNRNQLETIHGLETCPGLMTLNASLNKLTSIPALDGNPQLEVLDLSHNTIQAISGLGKQRALKKLDLSANEIGAIEHLESLDSITMINLTRNRIPEDLLLRISKGDGEHLLDKGGARNFVAYCKTRLREGIHAGGSRDTGAGEKKVDEGN
ncbi:hypothetical protein GF325_12395 [Candidatus Bathyarchaeota archaeon]|nr:hypothetical protein [Candidatus Bathyarchaeota archaeon]